VKTHHTAVVLIPPPKVWEPIQAIRRVHDKQVRRWMPHITLLYPFRPLEELPAMARSLTTALRPLAPFPVELEALHFFRHGPRSHTIWLAPEPAGPLVALEAALRAAAPDCDEQARHEGGFHPHLSVGQFGGRAEEVPAFIDSLSAGWRPLRFVASVVSLIARGDPPDDVFAVEAEVPLGGPVPGEESRGA
jgi:2'-5' RNA ligase